MSNLNGVDLIERNLNRFKAIRGDARRFHAAELGDVNPQKCFADFMVRVQNQDQRGIEKAYGPECVKNTQSLAESNGIVGGYLVPPEMSYEIMQDISGQSIFRPRAKVITMTSSTLQLPLLNATTVPAAVGTPPFFGGLLPKFIGSNNLPETEQTYRQVELKAWTIDGYAVVSQDLMNDGGKPLEAWFIATFGQAIAWVEDWYFLNGDGVACPTGIINAGCSILVTRNANDHFKTVDAQSMLSQLYHIADPVWLLSTTAMGDLANLTGWIPNGPLMLYGFDVKPTLKQPALGTIGDVVVVDPSMYLIGDRLTIEIDYSKEVPNYFQTYQGVWRFIRRVDGQPMLNAPIYVPDANVGGMSPSFVSPFVVLGAT